MQRPTLLRRPAAAPLSAALAMAALAFAAGPAAAGSRERPNVVILLADDLGYRDVGCYDGPVRTPAIDSLAAGGARFTDFHSGCAVCSPSRATLLTGRHHIRTGVYSWIADGSQRSHLLRREVTLAEVLRTHGYATAHAGKWHLGLPTFGGGKGGGEAGAEKPTPAEHGFDYWFATANNAEPSHEDPTNFVRNGTPVGRLEGYSCDLVVDEAVGWLDGRRGDRDADAPFFLNVWFHEPHAPLAAPAELVREYGEPGDRGALYSATIDNTDRAIARLLARLAEIDDPGHTLVLYASDNGSYRADRTGVLRGTKGTNWEGGLRVPGIFHWPGVIPAGTVVDEPAGLVDVLPTVCGLLGVDPPADVHLDGADLTPLLTGRPDGISRPQPLFWHLQKARPIVALRDGRYSLVADPDYELSRDNMFREAWIPAIRSGGYTNYRLYDLETDPSQSVDLAAERPEVLERLKADLLQINAGVMADGVDWHLK
ncbi:sulfatase family protein [Alienimonas californiensis]|uniref:Arylsulfatase n=1 Tax=Alienimonas californiensis TaxID=2527989 RepID=A0A517PA51_9PLAN|nr:sulfatase-like hydrolase/transferase [Alienimonas californiensis]QDT16248.1 Arylsulfatase [Alienimonas californiensis]